MIQIDSPAPPQIECRLSDSATPHSGAKPFGAIGAQVFVSTAVNSSTQVDLTDAVNVATGQTWLAPARYARVRTQSGGYVAKSTGTF